MHFILHTEFSEIASMSHYLHNFYIRGSVHHYNCSKNEHQQDDT